MMDSLRVCVITVLCTGAIVAQPLAGAVDAHSDELGHSIPALPAQSDEQQLKIAAGGHIVLNWSF